MGRFAMWEREVPDTDVLAITGMTLRASPEGSLSIRFGLDTHTGETFEFSCHRDDAQQIVEGLLLAIQSMGKAPSVSSRRKLRSLRVYKHGVGYSKTKQVVQIIFGLHGDFHMSFAMSAQHAQRFSSDVATQAARAGGIPKRSALS
jgi:hypothetical protein